MSKRIATIAAATLAGLLMLAGIALADAPNGNSGHNSNGDTQCQNSDSNPNCPPVSK